MLPLNSLACCVQWLVEHTWVAPGLGAPGVIENGDNEPIVTLPLASAYFCGIFPESTVYKYHSILSFNTINTT